jgi:predicted nuclease of predicted toxin-antitoxin system
MRFHLDESVTLKIGRGMRLQALDVTTSQEVGLLGASDEIQFEFAQREKRVLLTQDSDFLRIASRSMDHHGVIFFSSRHISIGSVILEAVALEHSDESIRGIVKYL